MAADAHLPIEVVSPEGKPLLPKANAIKFVHQCGVVVRDLVPISTREWNKPKGSEGVSYVDDRLKGVLWDKLIAHFTLPIFDDDEARTNAMREKVKHFALKKMAEQFNKYKNRLHKAYVKDKKVPKFEGTLEKQRAHWDSFLEYKNSEIAKQRSEKNKENAAKKKYHHKLGPGGYGSAEPKWAKAEAELRKKGVTPSTEAWPTRARNWLLGHGAKYDMETGELQIDEKAKNPVPHKEIVEAISEAREGKFIPDRENDELTKALGNPEKSGRTRGLGPDVPWIIGFPEQRETYRRRERAKKRKEQAEEDRIQKLERQNKEILAILDELRGQGATHHVQQDSQRRSSVASTGVGAAGEAPMDRYPVDNIREKTPCELHVPVRNLSFKAADGYALTCESTALWHCNKIPDGYGRVGVDEILPGYDSLELDIPGAEDERTLGEVGSGIILWKKKYIVFPGSPPRPPPSPPSRDSPPPSPHNEERDEHHSASPRTSPRPHQATPEPTPPPPPTKPQGEKRKRTDSSMGSSRKTREEPLPRVQPPLPKRAYDKTDEELKASVDADVQIHFAPKKPEPKQTFSAKEKKWAKAFIEHPSQIEINRPDDYVRCLRRVKAPRRKKGVAQLGEQSKQSISPLKVLPTDQGLTAEEKFCIEAGITLSQVRGGDIPVENQLAWTWEYGKSLLPPDDIAHLPTQMRKLHEWYLEVTKEGRKMILVKVTEEHFIGKDQVQIYLEELYMLYKLDALDLSLVSTYCL